MLYLIDANILITANSNYYPIEQVPEFWEWLQHQGSEGNVKMPVEIIEEVKDGREGDPLRDWIMASENEDALRFDESVDSALVQRAVSAYASDLTDDELEKIGRDPFLIAYAMADSTERCVATTEVSRPSAQRQNRKIPDVCRDLGVISCGPFELNKALGFRTKWK